MSQTFTITNQQSVFTATVVRSGTLTVSKSTNSFSASVISPGFTATLMRNILTVSDSTQTNVNITPVVASVFTGTVIENVFGINQTVFNVTATNAVSNVTIDKSVPAITVTYNPTLVEHVYDGQPVYTTSSPRFKTITLGNTSTFTFPEVDGGSGFALLTDGNGQLYWGPGGGGGGLATWSLNSDLTTNGFKIKSGSGTVALEVLGGNGKLGLEETITYLEHTGTGALSFRPNNSTELTYGSKYLKLAGTTATLFVNSSTYFAIDPTYATLRSQTIALAGDVDIAPGGLTVSQDIVAQGDITAVDNIQGQDVTGTRQLISPRAYVKTGYFNTLSTYNLPYIDVPPLRLSDGSVLYGAQTISTGTLSLNGVMYTNNWPIKSNTGVGTLTLQQGNSLIEISNDPSNEADIFMQVGPSAKPNEGGGSIYFDTSTVYGSRLSISVGEFVLGATTSTFNTQPRFNDGIKFADNSVLTSANKSLDDLTDVQVSNPQYGQVLKYDGTKWYNGSDSGSGTTGTGVDTITAGPGIDVNANFGDITISNTGVINLSGSNGLVVSTATGYVSMSIGNLPIIEAAGGAIVINTATLGTTIIGIDYLELFDHMFAGPGIYKEVNEQNKNITFSTTASGSEVLSDDLYTVGFDILGRNNALTISAGETYIGDQTRQSKIEMPVNDDMLIYSDYGIIIDTTDDTPVQVLSPFIVSHRDGSSRISTEGNGLLRLNDTIIAVTATNRIILNKSVLQPSNIKFQPDTGDAYIEINPTTATIAAKEIRLASTATIKVGTDIYNSKLAVQDITNWNETGPVTVSKGIQFPDLSVQRTAYQGFLNFGQLTTPATNPIDFILQLQQVDFGTLENPGSLAFDAGTLD